MRPINNLVDLTNYVMLEFNQPLHAFDLDQMQDRKIVVRSARENEFIKTLDGEERKLRSGQLVIADAEHAQCIAGVMGAFNSEVTAATDTIFLESAYFLPVAIDERPGANPVKRPSVSKERLDHRRYRHFRPDDLPRTTTKGCAGSKGVMIKISNRRIRGRSVSDRKRSMLYSELTLKLHI